ncbi:RNA polymerase sigma factor [Bacteroidota bacterium]
MDRYTDSQLLDGILHSDSDVINFIYQKYYGKVENFLVGKGGNPEHIKDVFQEAMIIVCQKVKDKGLILTCSFSTYLFAVCKNVWMHDLRKNRYQPVEDSSLDVLTDEPEQDEEMKEKLKALFQYHFSELSEDCQKLLRLHLDGVPLADIQRIFGYSSEHYTSDRKYRCKQSLYKRIKNDPKYKKILADG